VALSLQRAGRRVLTKATLSFPLLGWTGERKCHKRLVGRGKGRERSLSDYHHRQNIRLAEISFIYCQLNWSRVMRNKTKS